MTDLNMRWQTTNDKLSVLKFYEGLGLTCTCVKGCGDDEHSYKEPIKGQLTTEDWEEATGIGIKLGGDDEIRAIDIDGFQTMINDGNNYTHGTLHQLSVDFFVKKCLELLGLPEDYEWMIKTPNGWHILISSPSIGYDKTAFLTKEEYKPNIINGNTIRFKSIELLWNAHLVMPPSFLGKYYRIYSFYNQIPQKKPTRVTLSKILDFVNYYCGNFKYIEYLTDEYSHYIIGDAHLFPHYEIRCSSGSEPDYTDVDINFDLKFLNLCRNSAGYNALGVALVVEDLVARYKVEQNLHNAVKLFNMANDPLGHYNMACLLATGALNGSVNELYKHLELAAGFPQTYKEQLELLYFSKNKSYVKYAIIDVSTNTLGRLDKIAVLVTNVKGCIYYRYFLKSESSGMLRSMFYALNMADYIVGCNLEHIIDLVKKECEIVGESFSFDSDSGMGRVHEEGNYLDVFIRPHVNLPSLQMEELDPFRRIYAIKALMCKELNKE